MPIFKAIITMTVFVDAPDVERAEAELSALSLSEIEDRMQLELELVDCAIVPSLVVSTKRRRSE